MRKRRSSQKIAIEKPFFDINVDENTHTELMTLVSKIPHQSHSEVEKILIEADRVDQGDTLRQAWKQDVEEWLSYCS